MKHLKCINIQDVENKSLIEKYYKAFNQQDVKGMLSCLHPHFSHDINEGSNKKGIESFENFLHYMNEHYLETLTDIVIMSDGNSNYAAKFIVNGKYLKTDGDLPVAKGQTYKLPAATFFK